MSLGWLFFVFAVSSSIWVYFDAPHRGLSRGWSLACLLFWTFAFPFYLIERARAGDPSHHGRGGILTLVRGRLTPALARARGAALLALVVAIPLTAAALWELRVFFRAPYMLIFVRHPALISVPLLAAAAAFLVHLGLKLARRAVRRRKASPEPVRRSRKRGETTGITQPQRARRPPDRRYTLTEFTYGGGWRGRSVRTPPLLLGPAVSAAACAAVALLFAAVFTSSWTGKAIYEHTDYESLSLAMLRGGEARLKPYEVAQRQSQNGLNSPTERPTNLHIVKVDGKLLWTSVRDPDGFFRVLSKRTKGVMSVDASSTAAGVRQSGRPYDADFRYGPGMRISDGLRWRIYKTKCYTCDVAEMTGVPTPDGPW